MRLRDRDRRAGHRTLPKAASLGQDGGLQREQPLSDWRPAVPLVARIKLPPRCDRFTSDHCYCYCYCYCRCYRHCHCYRNHRCRCDRHQESIFRSRYGG
jgi:hypothetical protein